MNVDGLKHSLGKKIGPLPMGAWLGILAVGFFVARYLRNRSASKSQDVSANTADTAATAPAFAGYDGGGQTGAVDNGSGYGDGGGSGTGAGSQLLPPGSSGGHSRRPAEVDNYPVDDSPYPGGDYGPNDPAPAPTDGGVITRGPLPPETIHKTDVKHDAPTRVTTTHGTKTVSHERKPLDGTHHPVAHTGRTTHGAPEIISEHGKGQVIPAPGTAGKHKTSPAVERKPPELISEHGAGQMGHTKTAHTSPALGLHSGPPLVSEHGNAHPVSHAVAGPPAASVARPSGHSVAIAPHMAPSAAPPTVAPKPAPAPAKKKK